MARRAVWLLYAFLAVTAVVAVGLSYAWFEDRRRREIVFVDFTAADSRNNLYPRDERLPSMRLPRRVELRFPGGGVHLDEDAASVEVALDPTRPGGVGRVSTTSAELDVHEAYGQARRLRDAWRIPESTPGQLEHWYEDHLTAKVGNRYNDRTKIECEAAGTDVGTARLLVSVEIFANTVLPDHYHLFVTFRWDRPDAKLREDKALDERAFTGTTVLRAPTPVC
jgi:hypothetical protein